jgi:hypothetical protein
MTFSFEQQGQALATRRHFAYRLAKSLFWAALVSCLSLLAGVEGYHYFEHLSWIDALLNASMILGGMGPVDPVKTVGGKLFASVYALYSGLVIIGLTGLLLAPVFHRILHAFHESRK